MDQTKSITINYSARIRTNSGKANLSFSQNQLIMAPLQDGQASIEIPKDQIKSLKLMSVGGYRSLNVLAVKLTLTDGKPKCYFFWPIDLPTVSGIATKKFQQEYYSELLSWFRATLGMEVSDATTNPKAAATVFTVIAAIAIIALFMAHKI